MPLPVSYLPTVPATPKGGVASSMPDLPAFQVVKPNENLKVEDFRLPDGSPMLGPDGYLVPPAREFSMVVNAATRVYSYRFDEAMRDSFINARAMRRDAFIRGLLEERILPTINRRWQIDVDNERDPNQRTVRDGLTKIVQATPQFNCLKRALLDGVWYGRAAVQWNLFRNPETDDLWSLRKWDPVHGDSIQFTYDGVPAILMDAMTAGWYSSNGATQGQWGDIRSTDRGGMALVLQRPKWRKRFAVYQHIREKADYFEGELAGSVQGLGLRGLVYWHYQIRTEALTWMLAYMQSVGQMDMLIFNYPWGNDAAKQQQQANANKIIGKAAFIVPRNPQGNWNAVEQLSMNDAGLKALHDLISEYFDRHIERLIVGQSMSSGADNDSGLGGSGRAAFAQATKDEILVYDTNNLDEVLTRDLLAPLKEYNFKWARFPVRFKSILPNLEAEKKVASGKTMVELKVPIKMDELREAAGYSRPEEGDEVVQPPPDPNAGPMGGGMPGMDGSPQPQPGTPPVPGGVPGQPAPPPQMGPGGGSQPPVQQISTVGQAQPNQPVNSTSQIPSFNSRTPVSYVTDSHDHEHKGPGPGGGQFTGSGQGGTSSEKTHSRSQATANEPPNPAGREFKTVEGITTARGSVPIHYDYDTVSPDVVAGVQAWLKALPQNELARSVANRIEIFEDPQDMFRRMEEVGIDPEIEGNGEVRGAMDLDSGTLYASTWNGYNHDPRTLYHELGHSILGMDEDAAESWAQAHLPSRPAQRYDAAPAPAMGYPGGRNTYPPKFDRDEIGFTRLSRSQDPTLYSERREGEVWQGPSGRWFMLKGSHVQPAPAPNGGQQSPQPQPTSQRSSQENDHGLAQQPQPFVADPSKLRNPQSAQREFLRTLKAQYPIAVPMFHEAPISALDSIVQNGLRSNDSVEGVNFATVGKPSGFVTDPDKLIVKFAVRSRPHDLAKIAPDMRYDPANPAADLLTEHGGSTLGADVAYHDRVLPGDVEAIYVVRGGQVVDTIEPWKRRPTQASKGQDPTLYGDHKFGCVMVPLTGQAAIELLSRANLVRDCDLADDGREDEPHVTVRYGFHDGVTQDEIEEALRGKGPFELTLGKVSCFYGADSGKDYDVLKVDVTSPHLKALHSILGQLPNTAKFKEYRPHATLAYVQAGKGKEYVKLLAPLDLTVTVDELTYSDAEKNKGYFRLYGLWPKSESVRYTKDAHGHEHKGKGPGGGQFTSKGGSSLGDLDDDQLFKHQSELKRERENASEDRLVEIDSELSEIRDEWVERDKKLPPEKPKKKRAPTKRPKSLPTGEGWLDEPFYHGSPSEINKFEDVTGNGISFTDNPNHSRQFGENLHEVRLNVKNPLDLTSLGSGAGEVGDGRDDRVSTEEIRSALADAGIHVQFSRERKGWTTDLLRGVMPEVIRQAKDLGYDALRVEDFKDFDATETVVFDPKQIHVVSTSGSGRSKGKTTPYATEQTQYRSKVAATSRRWFGGQTQYAAAHAPAGGVTVAGKQFSGGQFIPSDVMEQATPEERARVEGGESQSKSPKENWQKTSKEYDQELGLEKKFPKAKKEVGGLQVVNRNKIDNIDSISATLDDYDELSGIRQVRLSDLGYQGLDQRYRSEDNKRRVRELAAKIKASGKITPLIVVVGEDGPWVLEGNHRLAALGELGVDSLPALVVVDRDEVWRHRDEVWSALDRGDDVPAEVVAEYPDLVQQYPAERQATKRAVRSVVERLPESAKNRLRSRVTKYSLKDSVEEVTEAWYAGEPNPPPRDRWTPCYGFYDPADGRLVIGPGAKGVDRSGVLAHEIGHALDQSDDRRHFDLSGHPEFLSAWQAEMSRGQLSRYAATDEVEGFAEFCRLLYGTDDGMERAAREFPRSYHYFKRVGLI